MFFRAALRRHRTGALQQNRHRRARRSRATGGSGRDSGRRLRRRHWAMHGQYDLRRVDRAAPARDRRESTVSRPTRLLPGLPGCGPRNRSAAGRRELTSERARRRTYLYFAVLGFSSSSSGSSCFTTAPMTGQRGCSSALRPLHALLRLPPAAGLLLVDRHLRAEHRNCLLFLLPAVFLHFFLIFRARRSFTSPGRMNSAASRQRAGRRGCRISFPPAPRCSTSRTRFHPWCSSMTSRASSPATM